MLLTCTNCGSKVRATEAMAGKRVKCPKCATILRVPDEPESTGIAPTTVEPMPPRPASSGMSSKPLPPDAGSPFDFNEGGGGGAADEDEPAPRRDDDDEDSNLNVRRSRRGTRQQANGMAMAGMVLGIVSVSLGAIGICCCTIFLEPLAGVCGILAILFSILGKAPGSESYTKTGLICGICGLVCVLLGIIVQVAVIVFQINMNQGRGF